MSSIIDFIDWIPRGLNHIEIATKGMKKTALFLSVCYPFIAIPYPKAVKMWKIINRKWYIMILKLNGNKVLWIKKIKSLLDQIGLGKLWIKADYMDVGIFNITRQRLEDTSN